MCIVERIRYYDYITDENSQDQSVAKIQDERENSAIFPRPSKPLKPLVTQ